MSTLLGRNIPANSVGVLPDVYAHTEGDEAAPGYFASHETNERKARAAVINAKVPFLWSLRTLWVADIAAAQVILEQYRVKHCPYYVL